MTASTWLTDPGVTVFAIEGVERECPNEWCEKGRHIPPYSRPETCSKCTGTGTITQPAPVVRVVDGVVYLYSKDGFPIEEEERFEHWIPSWNTGGGGLTEAAESLRRNKLPPLLKATEDASGVTRSKIPDSIYNLVDRECPNCFKDWQEPCPTCSGTGKVPTLVRCEELTKLFHADPTLSALGLFHVKPNAAALLFQEHPDGRCELVTRK